MYKKNVVVIASVVLLCVMLGLGNGSGLFSKTGLVQDGVSLSMGAADYDSGWVDITNQRGKTFQITHNLGTREIMVDITGKTKSDGSPHQENLGATSQSLRWWKTYGGTSSDGAACVVQTNDGGYAIAGNGFANLVKTDSTGNLLWSKAYGGTSGGSAQCVVQTSDGGYAIAGSTNSFGAGGSDFWLGKTDSAGNMLWSKAYGGTKDEYGYCVVQTSDGGYAMVGITLTFGTNPYTPGGGWWLVKTDVSGNKVWDFVYDEWNWYRYLGAAVSVVQTVPDGGYAFVGNYEEEGFPGSTLVKIASNGVLEWATEAGGDYVESVIQTVDGGYVTVGYDDEHGTMSGWLAKFNSIGEWAWPRKNFGLKDYWGDSLQYADYLGAAYSVVQTSDGGYVVAYKIAWGWIGDYPNYCSIIKISYNGDIEWDRNLAIGEDASIVSIAKATDGGFVLAGTKNSDFLVVKTDTDGYLQGSDMGLSWVASSDNTLTLYRGGTDLYWNFVRVRIWTLVQAKLNTVLNFGFTPNPAKTGQAVTLSGTLRDANSNPVYPAQVKVEYSINGGASWSFFANLNTNAAGAFAQSFTAPGAGTYLVRASYAGSATYNPSSSTQTLTINP